MLLHLHVKPNSKTDNIIVSNDWSIRVKICAQPTDGKANKYLVNYLSEVFKLSKSQIEITKGHNSPHKTVRLDAEEVYIKNILKAFISK